MTAWRPYCPGTPVVVGLAFAAIATGTGTGEVPRREDLPARLSERQLTFGRPNKDLDNNVNFSPNSRFLVFDCRDDGGIGVNHQLGQVDLKSGQTRIFYDQAGGPGVGAASFLTDAEVVAIHGIMGQAYDQTVRGGMIIATDGSGRKRWLDSRNVSAPFTPGALRGGTHKHEPDASGQWIGFTYNDYVMKARGSDLRNVGVSRRGIPVAVPRDPAGTNFEGESFSVLLTSCAASPRPGSDEYQRAEGDCWVGIEGYPDSGGRRRRARAFRGLVAVEESGRPAFYSDVFIVDVPDDLTRPGPSGPLEGTADSYPNPPAGAVVRRLTRTAERPEPTLRGVKGHLRASGDGRWIACVAAVRRGAVCTDQLFAVSSHDGAMRQISSERDGVVGDPRFSPDSRFVAAGRPDGSVGIWSAEDRSWGRLLAATAPHASTASNVVISPDNRTLAYNRRIEGILQVFVADLP